MHLPLILRNRNFYIMLAADALLVAAAMVLSFSLRFDGAIPKWYLRVLFDVLPYLVPLKLCVFFACGLYHGMWRYTSLRDVRNVAFASLLSALLFTAGLFMFQMFKGFPRSVLVMDVILTFLFIGGLRVAVRLVMGHVQGNKKLPFLESADVKRVAVIGAGRTGERMVREMQDNAGLRMRPVALFDDDPGKWGKSMHGCPVLGGIDLVVEQRKVFDEILIGITYVKGDRMRQIVGLCEKTGKPYRMMPNLDELMDGRVSVKATRKVRFKDLLGRGEVSLDMGLLTNRYAGKRVLVTGAGGSIGSELVRQVGALRPSLLGLVDFSEDNLFRVELKTRQVFDDLAVQAYLADIRDMSAVRRVMESFRPQVVLHAAAYKHVPLQELNPWEAVLNNVLGTANMVGAAMEFGAEHFVLVSTDKAVRPTNVMGATKRVAEMLVECESKRGSCRFVAVRFGNVLGSSGSVVPIFESQIAARLPVTVTHPEVTRYFMSVSEAAQLILQAGAMAEGGEIFILDMGQPIRIADMARDLIRLHGLEPEEDVPIVFTGLRPGEKLYEELISEGEGIVETRHKRIRVIRGGHCDPEDLREKVRDLEVAARGHDARGIRDCLQKIVPEFQPAESPENSSSG